MLCMLCTCLYVFRVFSKCSFYYISFHCSFFPISLTVLENNDVEFLLGLDMLKRHRCCIDLMDNVLRIETSTGQETISFLGEADIPGGDKLMGKEEHHAKQEDAKPSTTATANNTKRSIGDVGPTDSASAQVRPDVVNHLMSLGFSHQEVTSALIQADGDVELAATLLYASRT